jgi:DNA-binding PadR family transcriptional regulator
MGRGTHLGELEALVLTGVLGAGQRANGAAVYQEIEARSGREVSLPAVHVTLRRLEAKGLLVSAVGEPSPRGGRSRRFYRPTPEGVRALQAFRAMWRTLWRGLELPDPETLS